MSEMTAVEEKTDEQGAAGKATGRVVRVIGPVVDVEFGRHTIPELNQALTTEIALGELSKTLTRSWEELTATTIVIDEELSVAASASGRRRLVAPTTAHLVRDPLTLFARSPADVGSPSPRQRRRRPTASIGRSTSSRSTDGTST